MLQVNSFQFWTRELIGVSIGSSTLFRCFLLSTINFGFLHSAHSSVLLWACSQKCHLLCNGGYGKPLKRLKHSVKVVETRFNYCYPFCWYVSYLFCVCHHKNLFSAFPLLFITFLFGLLIISISFILTYYWDFCTPSSLFFPYIFVFVFIVLHVCLYILLSLCFCKLCSDFIMSNSLNPSVPSRMLGC